MQDDIRRWQAQLGCDEDLVVSATVTPSHVIQVRNIGYRGPNLLMLDGVDDANQRTRILAPAGAVQLAMKW